MAAANGGDSKPSPMLTDEEKEELSGYEFPFENIVFEAGGAKGIAYIGALRVSIASHCIGSLYLMEC